jgi:hypothetical protein
MMPKTKEVSPRNFTNHEKLKISQMIYRMFVVDEACTLHKDIFENFQ